MIKPLFIVGASRSGTTMLNRILSKHPSVLALNELHYFGGLVPPPGLKSFSSRKQSVDLAARLIARARRGLWECLPTKEEFTEADSLLNDTAFNLDSLELLQRVMSHLGGACDATYVTDQTPRNIMYAHDLLEQIPELRVVQLVRDPRAVLYSQKRRWRKRWRGDKSIPFRNAMRVRLNYHPIIMSKLWNRATLSGIQLKDNSRFLVLKYEDVVADPRGQIGLLCDFLNLEFMPEMLEIEVKGSSHGLSSGQHRGISSESLELWREGLSSNEIKVCEAISGALMTQFGYTHELAEDQRYISGLTYLSYPLHLFGAALFNPRRVLAHLPGNMRGRGGI
jgi:hypothetical protein